MWDKPIIIEHRASNSKMSEFWGLLPRAVHPELMEWHPTITPQPKAKRHIRWELVGFYTGYAAVLFSCIRWAF